MPKKESILEEISIENLINIVKESKSYKDVALKMGYKSCPGHLSKKLRSKMDNLNIDYSHFTRANVVERNKENVFCKNSTAAQKTLRFWYEKENLEYKCNICNQEPFWNGKNMTLILDHINGNNIDNRLENLRWVCGNCNIQLDTTNGKNIKNPNRNKN